VDGGGGLLRGVKLSGFDAGIRGFDEEGPTGAPREAADVRVEDACVFDTGRGIAWSALSAIHAKNVVIRDVLLNGVSLWKQTLSSSARKALFEDISITDMLGFCALCLDRPVQWIGGAEHSCGPAPDSEGGFVLENCDADLIDLGVFFVGGPGIQTVRGHIDIEDVFVKAAQGFGIGLFDSASGEVTLSAVNDTMVFQKGPRQGLFGDGFVACNGEGIEECGVAPTNGSTLSLDTVQIEDSDRAGISNFSSFVALRNVKISCAAFALQVENNGAYDDLGPIIPNPTPPPPEISANTCGCPPQQVPYGACVSISLGLAPPAPVGGTP
jgi:hypothetical protein